MFQPPDPRRASGKIKPTLAEVGLEGRGARLFRALRNPATRLWVDGLTEDGKAVRVEIKLNLPFGAPEERLLSILCDPQPTDFLARVGSQQWKPLHEVPELEGWVPTENTGLISK